MKRLLFVVVAALTMAACNSATLYTIEGVLEGAEGTIALSDARGNVLVQTEVENGAFQLKYKSESPFVAYVVVGEENYIGAVYGDDVKDIKVSGSLTEPIIEAGVASDAARVMAKYSAEVQGRLEAGEDYNTLLAEYQEFTTKLSEENKDNLYGVMNFIQQESFSMEGQAILDRIATLPKKYQEMEECKKLVDKAHKMLKVAIGNSCIEIVAPDAEGNEVRLSDVYKANKYTLIDFWASWCGPCMGEVPYLVADYAKYHESGFEIFGVSLDSNKEAWLKAIETKGLVWVNVSNVKGWEEPAAADYAVSGIPSNFLVDSEGVIVAKDLRGEALGQKLEELLK